MSGFEKGLFFAIVVLAVIIMVASYHACREKFPDAAAWACAVKP